MKQTVAEICYDQWSGCGNRTDDDLNLGYNYGIQNISDCDINKFKHILIALSKII